MQMPATQLQYVCKGGGFVKYYGLKQATVRWKSDGYVGFTRIELVANNLQISLQKKVKTPGAITCTG